MTGLRCALVFPCALLLLSACGDDAQSTTDDDAGGSDTEATSATSGATSGPTSGADESGSVDESGGGDASASGGSDGADLDQVEDACEADCEAQFATDCTPVNQNELVCKLNCAVGTTQLGNFCLAEYAQLIQCRADGGYDCVNGYPTPRSTCALEQSTFSECTLDLGCKRWCSDGTSEGCVSDSYEACLSGCMADGAALPETCSYSLDQFLLCQAQLGTVCEPGAPELQDACNASLARAGECVYEGTNDLCEGYCYVAEELACPENCVADCEGRLSDPTCSQQFQSLAECELRYGDFECIDGRLVGVSICDGEETSYQACLDGA